MGVHGVEASEYVPLSNMKFLFAEPKGTDKVVDYRREACDDRDLLHDNSHHKLAPEYSYGLFFQIVIDKCLLIHDRGFKKGGPYAHTSNRMYLPNLFAPSPY